MLQYQYLRQENSRNTERLKNWLPDPINVLTHFTMIQIVFPSSFYELFVISRSSRCQCEGLTPWILFRANSRRPELTTNRNVCTQQQLFSQDLSKNSNGFSSISLHINYISFQCDMYFKFWWPASPSRFPLK